MNGKLVYIVMSALAGLSMAFGSVIYNELASSINGVTHRIDRLNDRVDCVNMRLDFIEAGKTTRCYNSP